MTVATKLLPNYTTQAAATYKAAIDATASVHDRLAGAFACHEQATPNLTVRVDAGHLFGHNSGALTEVAAQSTATLTAPATNPRKDIVYIDRLTGVVGVAAGAEAASPADPAIPAGKVPVGRVNWTVGMASITNSTLDDIRDLSALGTGTAAGLDHGTAAGNAVRLDPSTAKLPAVDGSLLVNLPLDATLASDNRLAWLVLADLKGDRLNMVNGWADPLKDETDIETAQNVAATFVSTGGGYYHNPGETTTPSAAGEWTGATGSFTFAGDDIVNSAADACIKTVATFAGDFSATFLYQNFFGASSSFGFYLISADASFSNTNVATDEALSGQFCIGGTAGNMKAGTTTEASSALTAGDVVKIERVGTAVKFYKNAALIRTMTATSTGTVRIWCGSNHSAGGFDIDNVSWTFPGSPAAMTVVSKQVVAAASAPTVGRLHVQTEDITGGSVVNTDFKGYVSRDNGTTYTQGTLVLVQTLADQTKAYEFDNLSISGQPSGTQPRFKFTTHNSKQIRLHGAVVQWK